MAEQKEYTDYDVKKLYDSEIYPLVNALKKICKLNNVPIMISCAVKNRGGKTCYENDGIFTGSSGLKLYDDQFERMLLVMRGAKVAPLGDIEFDKAGMDYIVNAFDDSSYRSHFEAKTRISVMNEIEPEKIIQLKEALPVQKKRGRPKKNVENTPVDVKADKPESDNRIRNLEKKPDPKPAVSAQTPVADSPDHEMVSFIGDL